MAWERIDRWPGDAGGEGAFRGASEPVVAERGGPTPWERARLWWHSSPELPLAHVARRAALTSGFVYVERRNGRMERAPRSSLRGVRRAGERSSLRGVRRAGARLIFGVVDGEDLVLPHRPDCALSKALLGQLGGGADEAWTGWQSVLPAAIVGTVSLAIGAVVLASHPLSSFVAEIRADRWSSEQALGFYGGWVALLVGIVIVSWLPSRARVDQLGVEVRRGLIPWLPFFRPAERFRCVRVREVVGNRKGFHYVQGYEVVVVLREAHRFASIRRRDAVRVAFFSVQASKGNGAIGEAATLARWLGKILGVDAIARPT